ncbi:unnamed protein product [Trichobilharzia regenti]|nr:unnamed protein product [Trichobilharzia regenti]
MRCETTAYYPKANGMLERLHQQLKARLSGANNICCTESLLGVRNALKTDGGCTVAELIYGTTLRLPCRFVSTPSFPPEEDHASHVSRLTYAMSSVKPASLRPQLTEVCVHSSLKTSPHVFVRRNSARCPLESPYSGPFKVIKRMQRQFVLDNKGRKDSVGIGRLQRCTLEPGTEHSNQYTGTAISVSSRRNQQNADNLSCKKTVYTKYELLL